MTFFIIFGKKNVMELIIDKEIELKTEFHKLIDEIQDMEYLKRIYECLVEQFHKSSEDFADLTVDKLKQFDKSMFDVKQGHFYTTEQIKKETQQWLTK
jgi:hypothetical protein